MLLPLLFLTILLSIIYIISRRLLQLLYALTFVTTKNRTIALWTIALFLLPGTIVHELSHFFTALLLRVPTGRLSIFPSIGPAPSPDAGRDEGEIRAGHLEIARTGPIRHTIIGVAPMFVGLLFIYTIGHFFFQSLLSINNYQLTIINIIGIYLLFVVSTTMFSSKADMRSFIFVAPVIILLVTAVYLAGVRVTFTQNLQELMIVGAKKLNFSLAQVGIIDTAVFLLLQMVVKTPRPKRPGLL